MFSLLHGLAVFHWIMCAFLSAYLSLQPLQSALPQKKVNILQPPLQVFPEESVKWLSFLLTTYITYAWPSFQYPANFLGLAHQSNLERNTLPFPFILVSQNFLSVSSMTMKKMLIIKGVHGHPKYATLAF